MAVVKICGIREPYQALVAAEAGSDYIGMIFAPSRRQITLERGQEIVAAVRERFPKGIGPLLVGVFADEDPVVMNEAAEACDLDLIQLSGHEPWELCKALDRPAIKAVKVGEGELAPRLLAQLERGFPILLATGSLCLIDAHVPGVYGGAGERVNAELAKILAESYPFLLAGGLTPENVGETIALVRPWGVDVSSGVETDGVKEEAKIRAFIQATRETKAN